MFIIIEHNGDYIMGIALDEQGDYLRFNTKEQAEQFVNENCAFNSKIVEL